MAQGKPRSDDTRHDFREWLQILDWIVVNIFDSAPLMDDHEAAQERVSNPALSWLRAVAVAKDEEGRLGQKVAANDIVELCGSTGTEIPGLRSPDVEAAARQVGSLMGRLFRDESEISVDGFVVQRLVEIRQRPGGGPMDVKTYVFRKP